MTVNAREAAPITILFADDQRSVADAAAKLLRQAGFRVIVAADAPHALTIAQRESHRISLVVADVRMPLLGGRELVSALRANGVRAPALYVSDDTPSPSHAHDYDDELFLAEPWSFDELVDAVTEALKRSAA